MEQKKEKIYKQYIKEKDRYDVFGKKMTSLIEDLLKSEKIDYQSISYRTKNDRSFYNKLEKKIDKYSDIADITDIVGIRVITYYSDSVDQVAEIISRQFNVDEKNTIDKRKALDPDRFGYLSLHYVVSLKEDRFNLTEYSAFKELKLEIQIRSISQHTWAEIEHDLGYKSEIEIPKNIRRDFYRLAGLLELVDKEFIEIREKLKAYSDDIETQIIDSKKDILIDSISIKSYIQSSDILNELEEEICKLNDAKLEFNEFVVSSITKYLNLVGFNTIHEVDDQIKKNKEGIYHMAKNIIRGKQDTLAKGIGLFYLCYYKVAETQSVKNIMNYLIDSGLFKPENQESTEATAEKIIRIYEQYLNKV
ncbi:GTP pyrophosphokinase [Paraclostridium bifermentans]|uniref:GTP pyrophosphokinase n=1 Tax=Paraclostridium bifermentans TaxID=1490 RepID=UPI0024B9B32F|nr:hypothetical protein [Paraclostridium bifermentans]